MTACERQVSYDRCVEKSGRQSCAISDKGSTVPGERSSTPPIPDGTRPLQLQVAGHVFGRANGQKRNKIGFLQSDDGTVLKPVLDRKGQREVNFYHSLFNASCNDPMLCDLRKFVPKFLGIWTTPVHPGQTYIRLEDVTYRFRKPSVMDIKVGPITYDCEADEAKINRETNKFPALGKVGFQVVGIKRYDPAMRVYDNIERTFLRTLNEDTILTQGLAKYFDSDELVSYFLHRLKAIESWFEHQTSFCFIASSLLFIYDSESVYGRKQVKNGKLSTVDVYSSLDNNNNDFENIADVRMIDLTHVFPTEGLDTNYLIGLRSLIVYLSRLKKINDF